MIDTRGSRVLFLHQTMWLGVLAVAWMMALTPPVWAAEQEATASGAETNAETAEPDIEGVTVRVIRFAGTREVDLDMVSLQNLGQDNSRLTISHREPEQTPVLTPELEQHLLRQIVAVAELGERRIEVNHDLPIFKGATRQLLDLRILADFGDRGLPNKLHVGVRPGDGKIDPRVKALLTTLLQIEGHLESDGKLIQLPGEAASEGTAERKPADEAEPEAAQDAEKAKARDKDKAGDDSRAKDDAAKEPRLTGLRLGAVIGKGISIEKLDQAEPVLDPIEGEKRTLTEAEIKRLRTLIEATLSSLRSAKHGTFATMQPKYDFTVHGLPPRLMRLEFQYGDEESGKLVNQGEPNHPEVTALLDYLFELSE